MDSVLKLVALMISFSLVHSRETIKISKSIKLNEMMMYECVDIYKQPSLNHPLLRNHKIQMKPSFSTSNSKSQIESEVSTKIINCPNETVPILKPIKEYVPNVSYSAENHVNPFTDGTRGTHFAGVRLQGQGYHGIASWISVHDLNISKDQVSYAQIYVENRVDNKYNSIQVGWMINPSLHGDGRPWSYGFFKGAHGGCYNSRCLGFIQVSRSDPLSEPLRQLPEIDRNIALTIQQDIESRHWWVTDIMPKKAEDIHIGYWPKELFDIMDNGVNVVGVGGAVVSSLSGISPPMGKGHLPTKNDMESARVNDILIRGAGKFKGIKKSKLETILDSNKCYGVRWGKDNLFTFGGPGGNSC